MIFLPTMTYPPPCAAMVDRMQQHRVDITPGPIHQMLEKLQYPLYFLDFETVATAVPLFVRVVRPGSGMPSSTACMC